jgi:hypothetical protein
MLLYFDYASHLRFTRNSRLRSAVVSALLFHSSDDIDLTAEDEAAVVWARARNMFTQCDAIQLRGPLDQA